MTIICEAACLIIALAGAMQQLQPPPVDEMPLSVTSYWLFDDSGNPVAWGGQADGDPHHYANMYPTSPDHAGKVGACISAWVKRGWTKAISFLWQGKRIIIHCYDAFGLESYRQPFYHDGYGRWVVPVDILSPVPYHGLVLEWEASVVEVGDLE